MSGRGLLGTLIFLVAGSVLADDESLRSIRLAGESDRMARRLFEIDALLAAKQWPEAIQELQRIINENGDDLVPTGTIKDGVLRLDHRHARQARWLCHERLAALPAEALELYRRRVDPQARQWLDDGRANRDPLVLQKLLDEAFCSSVAAEALDLLGDLAFERGTLGEAERRWRLLEKAAASPRVDIAQVRAKRLLVRLFQGEHAKFHDDLDVFRRQHGTAEGHLAGRKGNLVAILEAEFAGKDHVTRAPEPWATFAGDFTRNSVTPLDSARLQRLIRSRPGRQIRLDTGERASEATRPDPYPFLRQSTSGRVALSAEARMFGFHPVIAAGHVFVADSRRVLGFELSGASTLRYEIAGSVPASGLQLEPNAAFTLSVSGGKIYARLGATALDASGKGGPGDGFLVCLEPDPAQGRLRERWLVKPPADPASRTVFEGAPVAARSAGRASGSGLLVLGCTHINGERARSSIACYDADTGRLRWQQDMCETAEFKQGNQRSHHHLLTWSAGRVVYCSHSGAIVALEADSGRRAWAVRYPSRGPGTRTGQRSPRELAPCLYADGRIFVAPLDYDRVLCLDAETGQVVWESNPLEVVHLLGVAGDRLIVTATTPYVCVRALDARTGRDLRGQLFPEEDAGLVSMGRGLLTDRAVLWPTQNGVQLLDLDNLRPRADFALGNRAIRGNLLLGPDHLIAVDRDILFVFDLPR